MPQIISIAIDGPSGAGKSSLARRCAEAFGFRYVDTGAIYRTVAFAAIQKNLPVNTPDAVSDFLHEITIEIQYDELGVQHMILDGEDVTDDIRTPEVSVRASDLSALPAVRQFLMDMQRNLAKTHSVIMDGRDIGTVVLPDAGLKIFLTASVEERARRRMLELQQKGEEVSFDDVLNSIAYRDCQDSGRETAPLKKAEDAVLLDTTDLSFDESFAALSQLIMQRFFVSNGDD